MCLEVFHFLGIWISIGLNFRLADEISNSNSPGLGYIVSGETMDWGTHAQEKKKKKIGLSLGQERAWSLSATTNLVLCFFPLFSGLPSLLKMTMTLL
jgi:hypothetical protein